MEIRGIETPTNALRQPFEGFVETTTKATPAAVYEALADLQAHLEWGGRSRPEKMRLRAMEAPPGPATAGTEFVSTGSDPFGTFLDRSVVTEATPGRIFEFVTEAVLTPKRGGQPIEWTIVHRYEMAARADGTQVSYRYRITRISRLIGPLRLLRTPLAVVLRKAWATVTGKGLHNLVSYAEER